MPDFVIILAVILATFCGMAIQDGTPGLTSLLPDIPDGWHLDGEDQRFDRETIFEYMNGAGEVYLSFDYRGMVVRRLIDDDGNEIVIELYDMGNGPDAFGIFSRNWSGDEAGIGQGSEYRSGYLLFWKHRFLCTVFTYEENESTEAAIMSLGAAIAGKISETSPLPPILELLPAEQRVKGSTRYFHLYTDLNQHYFVADENILNLGPETNAALAQYGEGQYPAILVVIYYPSPADAEAAFEKFTQVFMPESIGKPLQIEDGTWVAAQVDGGYIVTVFDAADKKQAEGLLAGAIAKIREKENE